MFLHPLLPTGAPLKFGVSRQSTPVKVVGIGREGDGRIRRLVKSAGPETSFVVEDGGRHSSGGPGKIQQVYNSGGLPASSRNG